MLQQLDIIITLGGTPRGDIMEIMHQPTGISRVVGPPLKKPGQARYKMLREIEAELIEKGLTQHLIRRGVQD